MPFAKLPVASIVCGLKSERSNRQTSGRAGKRSLSYAHLASLIVGVLLAGTIEVIWFRPHPSQTPLPKRAAPSPSVGFDHSPLLISTNQPWGDLYTTSLALERPDELFPSQADPVQPPHWHFAGYSLDQLHSLFNSVGLSEPEQITLLDSSHCHAKANAIEITPPWDLVLHLPSRVRQKLYSVLAGFPENFDQRYPFLYRIGGFEEWFSESGLPPEKIELIERLSYTNANALCFADIELFRSLSSSNENYLLIKALSRVSTELVRLKVEPDNIDRTLEYWAKHGDRRALKPLLESVARSRDSRLGIGFFLPPFARLRLFTYSDPLRDPDASREDCYWSSMNFWNGTPNPRFFDFSKTLDALRTEYRLVEREPCQLGDVILFVDDNDTAAHMCVYLAADLTFTKNGAHYFQPWVIMRLDDVLARYPAANPAKTKVFRPKTLSQPKQTLPPRA
jgi:hypothetical protein